MESLFGMLKGIGIKATTGDGAGALLPTVPAGRNYYAEIEAPPGGGQALAGLDGAAFVPGQCYFSVRVVEMRLSQAGNYLSEFLPLCTFFLRYGVAGAKREIPYIVGYDLIQQALGASAPQAGASRVVFRDVYVARNVPFNSDGLEMYAALCRFADSSLSRGILDFVATAVTMLGGPAGGVIVKTGESLLKPLAKLFGTDGVSVRFGVFDGDALRRSGYRVLAGADSQDKLSELQLVDGVLHRKGASGQLEAVDDVDYLVMAFEQRTTLGADMFTAATALPFHHLWKDVSAALIGNNAAAAHAAYQSLLIAVAESPLLIDADRFALITAYAAQRSAWEAASEQSGLKTRGGGKSLATAMTDRANARGKADPVADLIRTAKKQLAPPPVLQDSAGQNQRAPGDTAGQAQAALDDRAVAQAMSSVVHALGAKPNAMAPGDLSRATRELLSIMLSEPA
ncbi:hypothetical protein ASE30_13835 [Achromobacter sp. Root83]|uniref:hypothetical protein n=1 Tax=Achromobacter sp. Root83 TaxID=1736602 RepID=UPI00070D8C5C|nr:hypothetical protein [Achromobacter sp. Root83]KRC71833.1 hypothetical protein ASE30_13835 [Achromobacter sp. Root83]